MLKSCKNCDNGLIYNLGFAPVVCPDCQGKGYLIMAGPGQYLVDGNEYLRMRAVCEQAEKLIMRMGDEVCDDWSTPTEMARQALTRALREYHRGEK